MEMEGYMKCKRCGNRIDNSSDFCSTCGFPLANSKNTELQNSNVLNCPNCLKEIEKGSKFCPTCGFIINTSSSTDNKPKNNKFKKRLLLSLLLLAIVATAITYVVLNESESAFKEELIKAIKSNNEKKIISLLLKNKDMKSHEEEDFKPFIRLIKDKDYNLKLTNDITNNKYTDLTIVEGRKYIVLRQYSIKLNRVNKTIVFDDLKGKYKVIGRTFEIGSDFNKLDFSVLPGLYETEFVLYNPYQDKEKDAVVTKKLVMTNYDSKVINYLKRYSLKKALSKYTNATVIVNNKSTKLKIKQASKNNAAYVFSDGIKIRLYYKTKLGRLKSNTITSGYKNKNVIKIKKCIDISKEKKDKTVFIKNKKVGLVSDFSKSDYLLGPIRSKKEVKISYRKKTTKQKSKDKK